MRIENCNVKEMAMNIPDKLVFGVYAGITKIRKSRFTEFGNTLSKWLESGRWNDWYEDVVVGVAKRGFSVKPILIDSFFWQEIDTPQDFARIKDIIKGK